MLRLRILSCLLLVSVLTGCFSAGAFPALNLTEVQLAEGNYKIVATGVSGEAEAGYLLGITISNGAATQTLSVARVTGSHNIYQDAMNALWENFAAEHGAVEGRRLALTNVRYDGNALNLLIYTEVRVSIRADVIEFTK